MNSTNTGLESGSYFDSDLGTFTYTNCALINTELQCNLMFRIVTRDGDANSTIQSINV